MTFSIDQYVISRPTLWHLTHRANVPRICNLGVLLPAKDLASGPFDLPRHGRNFRDSEPVFRDQDLLVERAIYFEPGCTMQDFLAELSRRVFFWSGWPDRPVRPGRRSHERYATTDMILRAPFIDIVARNYLPQFTSCNSGATRMQNGQRVRRGGTTFQTAEYFPYPPRRVVEVTFTGAVRLPETTEVARSISGPWKQLFGNG